MSREKKLPTSWGVVAQWYNKLLGKEDTFQSSVILPNLMRLLPVQKGEKVLDMACGQGFFSYALAACGAEVTGTDISPELVALAKKNAPPNIAAQFAVAPADKQAPITSGTMDRVLCVLAIQNIENVAGAFAEAHRALRPGGTLHLVLNHPSFRVPKGSSWEWDDRNRQYRRIDKYLSEAQVKIKMKPGDDPSIVTVSFHHPLQFFVKTLHAAGFDVVDMEEWASHRNSDSGPRAAEENRARNEIPMFMYVAARRAR